MIDHITNREIIFNALKEELVGPFPQGDELETSKFDRDDKWYGPWRQKGTGEEILTRDTPIKRYGVGVLYPYGTSNETITPDTTSSSAGLESDSQENQVFKNDEYNKMARNLEKTREKVSRLRGDDGSYDLDLSLTNSYHPSSMGVSFLAEIPENASLFVDVTGGRYNKLPVQVGDSQYTWWVRSPVTISAEFVGSSLLLNQKGFVKPNKEKKTSSNTEGLDIHIELYSRPYKSGIRLITICAVNRSTSESINEKSLFQSYFRVSFNSKDGEELILPYPRPSLEVSDDNEEELSLALLFRNRPTYAIGHGCSADWDLDTSNGKAAWVSAECLPTFETPSMTPDITDKDNKIIKVSMAELAGLKNEGNGISSLERVIILYEEWIIDKEKEIPILEPEYQRIAQKQINETRRCLNRMKEGLEFLKSNPDALHAFRLANHAVLLQQIQSRKEARAVIFDSNANRISFSEDLQEIDPLHLDQGRGSWRAFQIAFILMSLKSTIDGTAFDRETVELIWFPTGGGKTEAYLGLAAFALFLRRITNKQDDGVHVLMRYTLRLLTAQQFQRASRLICAMEVIRNRNIDSLGEIPFSIGLWVGGANTPNTRKEAIRILNGLKRGDRTVANKFILDRCPWCSAQIGPLEYSVRRDKKAPRVLGYSQEGTTVALKCSDNKCRFSKGLPVYVIDEDIYDIRPSLVIGTVDKFAMLAWRSDTRSLFGININGKRVSSPPGLIIQDELHLISGPLGSVVGLYEALIEELCTDRRDNNPVKPKIVCSTATIRKYKSQIHALYGRENVALFPPPGLEEGNSFFGKFARNNDGSLAPGRKYIGVLAPGLGSSQTVQVRTYTSLLHSPLQLPENERDPWWTLVVFFNSLRELGTTLSLLQSDIPDYQKVFINRQEIKNRSWRSFWEIKELTGRASGEDIPKSISALELSYPNQNVRPVDVCLASNILEVGIDIDRLSLMALVGQPKSTSQYIQVTGRVGRSWWERPGLIITIYGASKPRDRSHFEKFRSYHEKLYSQVEPTSVTPFSPPVLERALHAIMVAYIQQLGDENNIESPYPFPENMIDQLQDILLPRVQAIDPDEAKNFLKVFEKKSIEWKERQHTLWRAERDNDDIGLIRVAGAYATKEEIELSWPTQQSMRSVDAECVTEILLPPHDAVGDITYA